MIANRLLERDEPISQKNLLLYKEFLQCIGQGEFPLVENSATSSYLSTIVYLEGTDTKLHDYMKIKETEIVEFSMVRYVDDLYILFNSNTQESVLMPVVNRILNYYSSELKSINLTLNRGKTSWKPVSELNEELKKSLYDEYINGKEFRVTDLVESSTLLNFLEQLETNLLNYRLDNSIYLELIQKNFYISGVEYTPQEIYNSLVYEKHSLFLNKEVIDKLQSLIIFDYSFLKLDVKRLSLMVIKTNNGQLIKSLLSKLFDANRNGFWNIYDTSLSINYLLQRNFKHRDLLKILEGEEVNIYKYYDLNCRSSFLNSLKKSEQAYIRIFKEKGFYRNDDKLFFLYFMYMTELKKKNHLSAFAYFKNFFDRISAHLGLAINKDGTKGKPNYKAYYKESAFRKLYSNIPNSENIIKKAHEIRNSNPLSHSSAELIDSDTTHQDISESIFNLNYLIESKINELCMS